MTNPPLERAYTIGEIDALRLAVRRRYNMGNTIRCFAGGGPGERVKDDDIVIEEYVRTAMMAGLVAEDVKNG